MIAYLILILLIVTVVAACSCYDTSNYERRVLDYKCGDTGAKIHCEGNKDIRR